MGRGPNSASEAGDQPTLPFPALVCARFLRRVNRFVAEVALEPTGQEPSLDGTRLEETTLVHVPTTGRMGELLVDGARVYLLPASRLGRRTAYDLVLVEGEAGLVCIDSRAPNRLLARHWTHSPGPAGLPVRGMVTEPRHGPGRLDFLLVDEGGSLLVEVKSVTLVRDGVALFPDAPTVRGTRHLDALVEWVGRGGRAAAVFAIQREDGSVMAPNAATDPAFAYAFRRAMNAGVLVVAYRCRVNLSGLSVAATVPTTPA